MDHDLVRTRLIGLAEVDRNVAVVIVADELHLVIEESKGRAPGIPHPAERPWEAVAYPEKPREEGGDDAAVGEDDRSATLGHPLAKALEGGVGPLKHLRPALATADGKGPAVF